MLEKATKTVQDAMNLPAFQVNTHGEQERLIAWRSELLQLALASKKLQCSLTAKSCMQCMRMHLILKLARALVHLEDGAHNGNVNS